MKSPEHDSYTLKLLIQDIFFSCFQEKTNFPRTPFLHVLLTKNMFAVTSLPWNYTKIFINSRKIGGSYLVSSAGSHYDIYTEVRFKAEDFKFVLQIVGHIW